MNFNEKMRYLRNKKGMTQVVASKKIGISISALKNYEKDKIPDTTTIRMIQNFYKVPYEYLLNDNCINEQVNNLEIGKQLNFTDEAIKKVKDVNAITKNNVIDNFLNNVSKEKFWRRIDEYIQITNEMNDLDELKNIEKYSKLFYKYSTSDKIENYIECFEKCNGEDFYQKNQCEYNENEKRKILELIQILINNKVLNAQDEFDDGSRNSYLDFNYDYIIFKIKTCIMNNAYMEDDDIRVLLGIYKREMEKRKKRIEVVGFYISKEISNYLSDLNDKV